MKTYDFRVKVGDLVKHTSYKDLIGVVFEIDMRYDGSPIAVAWSGNRYGLGKVAKCLHHPDRLEVINESR
jgi:hypothetical protein